MLSYVDVESTNCTLPFDILNYPQDVKVLWINVFFVSKDPLPKHKMLFASCEKVVTCLCILKVLYLWGRLLAIVVILRMGIHKNTCFFTSRTQQTCTKDEHQRQCTKLGLLFAYWCSKRK